MPDRSRLSAPVPPTEFSEVFAQGMRDRMSVSYYKYGLVADAYPSKINALESLQLRLHKYAESGNTEYLMDAANFAMIEYMHPSHPDAHFKALDSHESPGRCAYDTNFDPTKKGNAELSDEEWKRIKQR